MKHESWQSKPTEVRNAAKRGDRETLSALGKAGAAAAFDKRLVEAAKAEAAIERAGEQHDRKLRAEGIDPDIIWE